VNSFHTVARQISEEVGEMKFSFRLTNAGLFSIVGLIIAVLLLADLSVRRAAPPMSADRIVTKEFVLLDSAGRPRARIAVDENDSPSMRLYDKQGTQRAQLRLNGNDVPSLRFYNAEGKIDSVLGYNLNTMEPALVFFDTFGKGRLVSTPFENVISSMVFLDADLHSNGRSGLRLGDWTSSDPNDYRARNWIWSEERAREAEERAQQEAERARELNTQVLELGDNMFHER
jgi:hypothetical protein